MIEVKNSALFSLITAVTMLVACDGTGGTSAGGSEKQVAQSPDATAEEFVVEARDEAAQGGDAAPDDAGWGRPVADPARYLGLYAPSDRPDRIWFVAEAKRPIWAEQAPEIPPGHLEIGAMFGDVSPWPMRTVSETEFEQKSSGEHRAGPIRVEFELDEGGNAVAMIFIGDSLPEEGRLERTGSLPEEWR